MAAIIKLCFFMLLIISCIFSVVQGQIVTDQNWGYNAQSTSFPGPLNWYKNYPICTLTSTSTQSPIDITSAPLNDQLPVPTFTTLNDGCYTWTQTNSLDDIEIDFTQTGAVCTNNYISYEGIKWVLNTMRFKSPSEHTVGGGHYDAEVQMYHLGSNGHTAVLSVFLQQDPADLLGTNNTFLNRLWSAGGAKYNTAPNSLTVLPSMKPQDLSPYVDFLPGSKAQYQYVGSLTEPPCTTDVDWFIMQDPVYISMSDLKIIRNIPKRMTNNLLSATGDNNRPQQNYQSSMQVQFTDGTTTTSGSSTVSSSQGAMYAKGIVSATTLAAFAFIFAIAALGLAIYIARKQSVNSRVAMNNQEMHMNPMNA